MKAKQVVALSFDRATFPRVDFRLVHPKKRIQLHCASYENDEHTVLIKSCTDNEKNLTKFINSKECQPLFQSNSLLLSVEKDIFKYNLEKRDIILVIHLLDSNKEISPSFLLSENKEIEKEKIYADWFLKQIYPYPSKSSNEKIWPRIYELLTQIDEDNPCTVMLMDGEHMVLFQGSNFANSLYYLRSCPPHTNEGLFSIDQVSFKLNALDLHHSLFLVSTTSFSNQKSEFLNLKQMVVVKDSHIVWNNDPNLLWEKNYQEVLTPEVIKQQNYVQKIHLLKLPFKSAADKENRFITIMTESLDKYPYIYSLDHRTIYEYDAPVHLSKHLFRLQPVSDLIQSLLQFEMTILGDGEPISAIPNNFIGAFGNNATFIEIDQPYRRLEIICKSIITIADLPPRRFDLLHLQRNIPLIWMPWDRIMMQAYLVPPELPESQLRELSDYALSFVKRNNHDVFSILNDMNRTIFEDFSYVQGSTFLSTTPYEVYVTRKGVCQDFANLFICLARLLNIPARYRTGYIYTAKDYTNHDQGDASHAWLEVFLPYIGWMGYDPTNYCLAEKNHIRVACGRTFSDATPTSGTIFQGGGKEALKIDVQVIRLKELREEDLF